MGVLLSRVSITAASSGQYQGIYVGELTSTEIKMLADIIPAVMRWRCGSFILYEDKLRHLPPGEQTLARRVIERHKAHNNLQ